MKFDEFEYVRGPMFALKPPGSSIIQSIFSSAELDFTFSNPAKSDSGQIEFAQIWYIPCFD